MAKQEVTYDSIIKEINSRQFAPVYYLMGEETYYIDRLSDYIAEQLHEKGATYYFHSAHYRDHALALSPLTDNHDEIIDFLNKNIQ